MILAIDIGNTNIVLGCIDEEKTYFIERIATSNSKMELEYAVDIKMVLDIHGIRPEIIEGAIISSVVPRLTKIIREAAEKIIKKAPLIVGPGVKNGMNILIENPGQMGSDLVADAVAAIAEYNVPLVILSKYLITVSVLYPVLKEKFPFYSTDNENIHQFELDGSNSYLLVKFQK